MPFGLSQLELLELGVPLLVGVVLLVGMWFLALRSRRLEERMRSLPRAEEVEARVRAALPEIERIRAIEEALRRVTDALAALPRPLQPGDMAPVLTELQSCAQSLGELLRRSDEQRAPAPSASSAETPASLLVRLHRLLEQRGYDSVRILSEVADGEPGEELRVPVEARRAGMSYKGLVTLAEGRVTEVALKPATEIFP